MPVEHFRSKEDHRRSRAYTHIHGIRTHASRVCVKNEGCHEVKHSAKKARRKAPARKRA
jgi:hypothetical protein